MKRRLPDQHRAYAALDAIHGLQSDERDNYKSYVNALPTLVRTAGLGQAVATYMAAARRGGGDSRSYHALIRHLEAWLCGGCGWAGYRDKAQNEPSGSIPGQLLILRLVEGDRRSLISATAEALAYLDWLKKLANALIEDAPSGNAAAEPASDPEE